MRHGRLVAIGLAAGALAGFVSELVRPRLGTCRRRRSAATSAGSEQVGRPTGQGPSSLTDAGVGPVRSTLGTAYTDAVTLAMAARGLTIDRLAVATDGEVHG